MTDCAIVFSSEEFVSGQRGRQRASAPARATPVETSVDLLGLVPKAA